MQPLCIIDAVGPFIVPDAASEVVNWSKVDFTALEKDGRLPPAIRARIIRRFEQYLQQVTAMGYDCISLDDLAHLALLPAYGPSLQRLLHDYRLLYKVLFTTADTYGVRVFINSDFLFSNDEIRSYMQRNQLTKGAFFTEVIERVLQDFPTIAGVIVRIGEHDGMDVHGTFLSRIGVRSPQEARSLLEAILPVFEHHGKLLIFRTWTVGAYRIGDLIWNERTFRAVFDAIHSDALIISMKFGETDFMRNLDLNPLFFASHHHKIIELQTRREWEGMGMYPSFVGWDYQRYLEQLASNPTIVGIHVWCQTGGWATKAWMNITFLDKSSFWNELNTFATAYMYRHTCTAETAVTQFCTERRITDTAAFLELLRLSEVAIHKGLYFPSLAEQELYFRRIKLPTLLWISWDRVITQSALSQLLQSYIRDGVRVRTDAAEAVQAVDQMITIAQTKLAKGSVPLESLYFEQATFVLFADLKANLLGMLSDEARAAVRQKADAYMAQYPQHYIIPDVPRTRRAGIITRWIFRVFIRRRRNYRLVDRLLLATSGLQRRLVRHHLRRTDSRLASQSMGLEILFK